MSDAGSLRITMGMELSASGHRKMHDLLERYKRADIHEDYEAPTAETVIARIDCLLDSAFRNGRYTNLQQKGDL